MFQRKLFNDYTSVNKQLPKLAKSLPLITYSITLEAWRRGIEVTFYSGAVKKRQNIYYKLKNGDTEYDFRLSFGGLMEPSARKIVNDKAETKKYLESARISTPKGKSMRIDNNFKEVLEYATSIGYPLVVKPLNARNATGVITNLKDEAELKKALKTLKDDLNYNSIIIEKYIKGEDTRVYVIEDKVIAAFIRRPANVIGDGRSSINDLIDEKNIIRQNNPHLKKFKIDINDKLLDYIKKNNMTLETVPEADERVYLNESTLHPDGCETVDVTEKLSEKIKKLSVDALKAVPGMKISGIDIMVDRERDEGYVLELNGAPNISGHIYPMEGLSRDVPKALIDHHFPETKETKNDKYKHFDFDFDSITKILRDGAVRSLTLPPLPKGNLATRRFLISGYNSNLTSSIHRTAVRLLLGGKIIKKANDKLIVKVVGEEKKIEEFTQSLMKKSNSKFKIKLTREDSWDGLYPYYFKPVPSKNQISPFQLRKIRKENTNLKKELHRLKKADQEKEMLIKELNELKKSRSWRMIRLLRKVKFTLKERK